ncbi:MAG: glucitol operon activator [Patescibacteria group bacterium]|jgi:DNA-binding transcriptional regulator of glucitol operon|nr:transcriptional regulator GutM [Chloroflexus aurantiacus]GIV93941.1 MAG: glucitol operon activator [Chloroflexus sp.]GIW60963.1 MAG: glucitol operon activator [Patescibacteria group bacterium]
MQPIDITASTIILGLAAAWILQLFLSYFQLRQFYGRVSQLRRSGRLVSVGMAGSAWRRRQYAILVVDPETNEICHCEQLSGWTVLARLKPLPGLEGINVRDLLDESISLPRHIHPKLVLALRNAAQHIVEFKARQIEERDQTFVESTPSAETTSLRN